jgi:predicted nucleotidyltransferase
MSVEEKYKQKIIALISALIPQAKIYLFGSRARKTHGSRSDIDIALDAGSPLNRVDVGEVREVLNATNIPYKIDVVDLYFVSKDMQEMIESEKVIWKQ